MSCLLSYTSLNRSCFLLKESADLEVENNNNNNNITNNKKKKEPVLAEEEGKEEEGAVVSPAASYASLSYASDKFYSDAEESDEDEYKDPIDLPAADFHLHPSKSSSYNKNKVINFITIFKL